jgi:hypothetical protein
MLTRAVLKYPKMPASFKRAMMPKPRKQYPPVALRAPAPTKKHDPHVPASRPVPRESAAPKHRQQTKRSIPEHRGLRDESRAAAKQPAPARSALWEERKENDIFCK